MSATELEIQIPPILPATAVVLCSAGFLSTLRQVEASVAALTITDAQSQQAAADLTQRLTKAGTTLEAERKRLKAPFLAKGDEIDAAAKKAALRIDTTKRAVAGKLMAYAQEQQRLAEVAERKRQDELRQLEEQRLKEERERQAKADEEARLLAEAAERNKSPVVEIDWGDEPETEPAPVVKTETEKRIEALQFAPAQVVVRPAGVRYGQRLVHRVTDVSKLPESFVTKTANDKAIRAVFVQGWQEGQPLPTCPGVEFTIDRWVISTGKAAEF